MNLRTTFVLLLLVGLGAAAWWLYPRVAHELGVVPKPVDLTGAGSPRVLNEQLARDKINRIKIQNGSEPFEFVKGKDGTWTLPGQWRTRTGETEELIDLITKLHSRFQVIPLPASDASLKPYGLDPAQKPVTVIVEGTSQNTLVFGELDSQEMGAFAKPTYVQINNNPEVMRMGPDILPTLRRPREYYQRRQLFPDVERVKFADASTATPFGPPPAAPTGAIALPRANTIALEGPQGRVVLQSDEKTALAGDASSQGIEALRLAQVWRIVEPVIDRPEPERLKALLAAIPNLWVESFTPPNESLLVAAALAAAPAEGTSSLITWLHVAARAGKPDWLLEQTGLSKPTFKVTIARSGGEPVSLHVGKVSQVKERPGVAPPPRPGMPPMPPVPVREEYRYAKLDGQPVVFEIKADKFNELFIPVGTLRDERLVRFQSKDVSRVEIRQKDVTILLAREKEKWSVEQPMKALAEEQKVSELIDKLAALDARDLDVIDKPNLKDAGLEPAAYQVTLTIQEEGPAPEKKKSERKVVFSFGKQDATAKKVNVLVTGRERLNLVDESAVKLVERPALAYRGRRVLDFDTAAVARIDVKRAGESYSLAQSNGEWKLTVPVTTDADKIKAGELAGDLGRLEAVEYVNDAPKPEDLTKAGLGIPELTATITYSDVGRKPTQLLVGKARDGKPEFLAKLADGSSVFAIKKELRDRLDQSSLDYRPTQLWSLTGDAVTALKVERGGEAFELKRDGFVWKIVKPFEANVGPVQVIPMVDSLATLKLQGFQAHSAANLTEFGLDKPVVKLTFTAPEKNKDGVEAPRDRTLLLGKAVTGKPEVFAKLSDDAAIFRVADTILTGTNKSALELLDRRLIAIDSRRIIRIERVGTAKMTLTKDNNAWKAQSDGVEFPADGPTSGSVLRAWESLQAERFAAYGPGAKLEEYGLKPPVDTVIITLDEMVAGKPVTHVLKLGKDVDGSARFAQLDDQAGVAVLSSVVVKDLARSHLDFADRTLLAVDEAGIQVIRRAMKGNDLEITRAGGWKVTKPAEQKADEPFMDDWSKQLATLRSDRVAAYAPKDVKPFGLDSPYAVVTIVVEKDGKQTPSILKIGSPTDVKAPDGDRFVMVEGSKVVGVLSRSEVRKLIAEPIVYRDRALVRRLPEPEKITLQRGERKVTFAKTDGTWKVTEPVAVEAEHSELEEFVNALFKLRADEFVAEKPAPEKLKAFGLDKPDASWRFFAGDKEVLSLLIGKRDGTNQRIHAKLGTGDTVFLLSPAVTARATAEYRKRILWSGFDAAQVDVLTLGGEGGPQTLRKIDGAWKLEGKPDAKVNQTAVTDLLGAMANLKAEQFIRDKDAPKELFGFGKPRRTILARTTTGSSQELHLGNIEGGSKRAYAMLPGQSAVFVLSEADTLKLNANVLDK